MSAWIYNLTRWILAVYSFTHMNVVLDVVQKRQPFYEASANVLDAVANKDVEGFWRHIAYPPFFTSSLSYDAQHCIALFYKNFLTTFTVTTINDTVSATPSLGAGKILNAVQMATARFLAN